MVLYRVLGQVVDLSASAVAYYRKIGTAIEGPLVSSNPAVQQNLVALQGPLSQLVRTAAPVGRALNSPAGAGASIGGGIAVGGVTSTASKTGSSAVQGLGFGTGYGVGVRAGYELGFPSLFGEEGTTKRQTVVQQGFSGGPLFDILRTISGGGDLGLKNGNRIRGDDTPLTDFDFQLGNTPTPSGVLSEGLGISDSIDVFKNEVLQGEPRTPSSNPKQEQLNQWVDLYNQAYAESIGNNPSRHSKGRSNASTAKQAIIAWFRNNEGMSTSAASYAMKSLLNI